MIFTCGKGRWWIKQSLKASLLYHFTFKTQDELDRFSEPKNRKWIDKGWDRKRIGNG